jgi:hypothetical protein
MSLPEYDFNKTPIENQQAAYTAGLQVNPYPFLIPSFLEAMNDIGRYGDAKYQDDGFRARLARGDKRWMERVEADVIGMHMAAHYQGYLAGVMHDHFGDLLHQLAAASYNVMMEAGISGHAPYNILEGK